MIKISFSRLQAILECGNKYHAYVTEEMEDNFYLIEGRVAHNVLRMLFVDTIGIKQIRREFLQQLQDEIELKKVKLPSKSKLSYTGRIPSLIVDAYESLAGYSPILVERDVEVEKKLGKYRLRMKGILDLLAINKSTGKTALIDFKVTSGPVTDEVLEKYRLQLRFYQLLLMWTGYGKEPEQYGIIQLSKMHNRLLRHIFDRRELEGQDKKLELAINRILKYKPGKWACGKPSCVYCKRAKKKR